MSLVGYIGAPPTITTDSLPVAIPILSLSMDILLWSMPLCMSILSLSPMPMLEQALSKVATLAAIRSFFIGEFSRKNGSCYSKKSMLWIPPTARKAQQEALALHLYAMRAQLDSSRVLRARLAPSGTSAQKFVRTAVLDGAPAGRWGMDAGHSLPVGCGRAASSPPRIATASTAKPIGTSAPADIGAGEPLAPCKPAFHEIKPRAQIRIDERSAHLGRDAAHHRLDEKRHLCRCDAVELELQQQRRHRRAFGEMQPIAIAQMFGRAQGRSEPTTAISLDPCLHR